MQVTVTVSPDRLNAVVGEQNLRVGGPITYKNYRNRMSSGTIIIFAVVDQKDMASPWAYVEENKSKEKDWIPLRTWALLGLPSQTAAPAPTKSYEEILRETQAGFDARLKAQNTEFIKEIVQDEEIDIDALF